MQTQKVPPGIAMNVTSDITIVPAQEAFLVDGRPTYPISETVDRG